MSVYVRARDGALYLNPLLVFEEGFVCFAADERPEIVLWISDEEIAGRPKVDATAVLQRVLGYVGAPSEPAPYDGRALPRCSAMVDSLCYRERSMRVFPGSSPPLFKAAICYYFDLWHRIPRPTVSEGSARYASRLSVVAIDIPADPYDVYSLEIPQAR